MIHEELVGDHIRLLAEIDSRSKSNTHRLDNMDKIIDMMHGMNNNIAVIAEQTKTQGGQLRDLINTLKLHEEKIEEISDKMGTKDSVARLHGRVDDLEKKDGSNAEKLLSQIKWLIITLLGSAAFYLIWNQLLSKI